MTVRQQVTVTLGSIADPELRNQVRFHLCKRFYNHKRWVVPMSFDNEWAKKAVVRILKHHGGEAAI